MEVVTIRFAILILAICGVALGWEMRVVAEKARREKAIKKRAEKQQVKLVNIDVYNR